MRIVSLCPSLTELVFDLGLGDELVGITRYCVHPARALERIEAVGGTKDPDVARVVALRPDVVLMNEEENRRADHEALRAAGLHVHSSFPVDVPGTAQMVRDIGGELEQMDLAERVALDIERRATRVAVAARGRPPVRFAYLIWRKPWMSVNEETFAHALIGLAGGVNVFGDHPTRYPEITPDELAAADPELVLLSSEPFPFEEKHADELSAQSGLPRARFQLADGEYLSWHGSRTPAGIDYAEGLVLAALRARGDSAE